jgi:hypothetical protein
MNYAIEIGSCEMICLIIFMKIDAGIQAISRFCLRNLRGCNVGFTCGKIFNYSVEMGSGAMMYDQVS